MADFTTACMDTYCWGKYQKLSEDVFCERHQNDELTNQSISCWRTYLAVNQAEISGD